MTSRSSWPAPTTQTADNVLDDILRIMDEGTSSDGWDIGILDDIDRYLAARGRITVDCEDL